MLNPRKSSNFDCAFPVTNRYDDDFGATNFGRVDGGELGGGEIGDSTTPRVCTEGDALLVPLIVCGSGLGGAAAFVAGVAAGPDVVGGAAVVFAPPEAVTAETNALANFAVASTASGFDVNLFLGSRLTRLHNFV